VKKEIILFEHKNQTEQTILEEEHKERLMSFCDMERLHRH